jgi:phosphoribosylaminoimidazole carboxylase PurK protein
MTPFQIAKKKSVGILGGGQLAMMLAQAATEMNVSVHILSENPNDPAAKISVKLNPKTNTPPNPLVKLQLINKNIHWHKGSISSLKDIQNFSKKMDIITFESEFIKPEILKALIKKKVKLRPSGSVILKLQDRLSQKKWLVKNKIATSPFIEVKSASQLKRFMQTSDCGIVLKKRLYGYDGYGTFLIRTNSELEIWLKNNAVSKGQQNKFKKTKSPTTGKSSSKSVPKDFIAEKLVPFQRELAVTLVRNSSGEIIVFPWVEWQARDAKCFWVQGPMKWSPDLFKAANKIISRLKKTLNSSKYVGAISFEFFLDDKELIVNEVAPRVHNSCHHSIESCNVSQFLGHMLAVSNNPLPRLSVKSPFAMVNLVGKTEQKWPVSPEFKSNQKVFWHWYGKTDGRNGRKMGHITLLAQSPSEALKSLLEIENKLNL